MSGEAFLRADGFGAASPILFTWPGATRGARRRSSRPPPSFEPDSATVLLDADNTGERLAHWAEHDHLTLDRGEPLIALRPAAPLPRGHRIIVAVRRLADADGVVLPGTPGFLALRDGTPSELPGIEGRRAHFDADIFPALAAAGVDRDDLQLAWDFTVASDENGVRTLLTMRDRLMEALGEDGPAYTLTSVEPVGDARIAWMATGVARVPSFLGPPDEFGLRRHHLDADGLPRIEGFEDVEFTLQVPASVARGDRLGGVVQYGHGFLGSKGQGEGGWLRGMADEYGFLILSADMQGMSTADFTVWLQILARRPSEFPYLYEKAMQGVMNHLALQRMMRGGFLREADERLTGADGQPLYDPADLMYYGNSQGGTMGAVIMSLTQDVRRGVLGVPGGAFPFLLQRSVVFEDFVRILDNTFRDRIEFSLVLGLLGTGWDPMDPMTLAAHIVADPLPGTPAHEVLLHVAKEDAQVHNQVSFMLARAIGVGAATPLVEPAWGLAPTDLPFTGSLLAEFDFKHPDNPDPERPPIKENDTHGDLRQLPAGQRQMMHFLRTGEVIDVCDGQPCRFDPP
ncbi:MAG: hypothetical protein R3F60_33295 [bacterium]